MLTLFIKNIHFIHSQSNLEFTTKLCVYRAVAWGFRRGGGGGGQEFRRLRIHNYRLVDIFPRNSGGLPPPPPAGYGPDIYMVEKYIRDTILSTLYLYIYRFSEHLIIHSIYHISKFIILTLVIYFNLQSKRPTSVDGEVSPKRARIDLDITKCLVCQKSSKESLKNDSENREKLLNTIEKRSVYGDGSYPEIHSRISTSTHRNNAVWHGTCYKKCIHKQHIERAKKRYEIQLATRGCSQDVESELNRSFTRNSTVPYDKNACFFCQKYATNRHQLHKVG